MNKQNANEIVQKMHSLFPVLKSELNFSNNYELLISVILSAQCTDKRVNIVTEKLFKIANTPQKMIALGEEKLKEIIKSCGFYQTKAHNIIKSSIQLIENFNGEVPSTISELTTLAGVGRKTANVVTSEGFSLPGLAVDTHIFRVSHRLELALGKTPTEVEFELKKLFDEKNWKTCHLSILLFGRYVCKARNPNCENCIFNNKCSFYKEHTQCLLTKQK